MQKIKTGKWFKKLTPKMAWQQYVSTPEDIFLSNFVADGVTDINKMCEIYASELPYIFNYNEAIFTTKDIEIIRKCITEYLLAYVEKQGGLDNIKLYDAKQLDNMTQQDYEEIVDYLMHRLNMTKQEVKEYIKNL